MSYITLSDIPQVDVRIDQTQIEEANAYIDRVLSSKGIDPTQVDPQNPHLKQLAINYALYRAYLLQHTDKESPYLEKAKELMREIERLEKEISSELLGIESKSGRSFGSFQIGRA